MTGKSISYHTVVSTDAARNSRPSGFTLIEVLVAVALGAVVVLALYSAFFTVMGAGSAAEEMLERRLEAARVLDRLTREVHGAWVDPGNDRTFFLGESSGMHSTLEMTSYTMPVVSRGAPFVDLRAVSYAVEEGKEGEEGQNLVRTEWNPYIGERVGAVAVEGVEGFEVSYYNGSEWTRAWNAGLEGKLPVAVKAVVTVDGGEEMTIMVRTMIK